MCASRHGWSGSTRNLTAKRLTGRARCCWPDSITWTRRYPNQPKRQTRPPAGIAPMPPVTSRQQPSPGDTSQTRLEGLSDRVRAAVATGLLPSANSDPAHEYAMAEQRLAKLRTTLNDTRERRSARRARRTKLSQEQSHLLREHSRQDSERTKL